MKSMPERDSFAWYVMKAAKDCTQKRDMDNVPRMPPRILTEERLAQIV